MNRLRRAVPTIILCAVVWALNGCAGGAPGPTTTSGATPAAPATTLRPASVPTAATTSGPRPLTTVRITDIQITSAAGSYIADAKGYFEQEGIRAEFIPVAGADQVPAVVSGTADVTGTAINAFLFNAFARGVPLKIVADHGANLPNASAGGVAIRKDLVDSGAYRGPADFRGWRVASGTPGSAADIALDRFLRQGGLTLKDVELVVMPFPDQIPALANRALEAAYYQEPFTTIAVERGIAVRGPIGYDVYPNQQIGVVLFGEQLVGDRDLGLRYLRAYTRGVRDYVKGIMERDPALFDELVPILIERTTVKERSLFERAIPSGLKADPIPNVQSIRDDQEWYLEQGLISQRVNLDEVLDLSLIEEVLRQLGPAR
ncbi:MAG: ABC transporter substrate-binding protein [Chloroflexi bacterium]|nr:ABC transporter substrate-binding protein [Chloroflexota bacterium]